MSDVPVNQNRKPVEIVYERDIDLLLVEEFYSSENFQKWFAETVFGRIENCEFSYSKFVSVEHSVIDIYGESDIEVTYTDANGQKWLLMIEDKINAQFQPDQYERYVKRGEAALAKDKANRFVTVLFAPKKYFGAVTDNLKFDARITYEQLAEWFRKESGLGKRGEYKAGIIETAIQKASSGESDEIVTAFYARFYDLVKEKIPELKLSEPKKRKSAWIVIPLSVKFQGGYFYHKMIEGRVDLHFDKMSERLDKLKVRFGPYLTPDMYISALGKSGAIQLKVPQLYPHKPFEEQEENAYQSEWSASIWLRKM